MTHSRIDLINRIGRIEVRPFLAPIPDARSVIVTTIQEGIQFNYRITEEPGWWILYCNQSTIRRVEKPTSMFEIIQFLEVLPRFLVIAVHRLRTDTWMVVPWNTSDANQRGWHDGEPKALHLVRDNIRPFDVVVTRRLGQILYYDTLEDSLGTTSISEKMREEFNAGRIDSQMIGAPPEMWRVHSILSDYVSTVQRTEQERIQVEYRQSVEGQLRWHLAFVGAELRGWHEAGEGYEVHWRYEGHERTTILRRDFQVASAGICLDGTDQRHNLSTIVGVMEQARNREMDDEW